MKGRRYRGFNQDGVKETDDRRTKEIYDMEAKWRGTRWDETIPSKEHVCSPCGSGLLSLELKARFGIIS